MADHNKANDQYLEGWRNVLRVLQSLNAHERVEHFDMQDWGVKTKCGTVACIAGHCALDPWFQKERGWQPHWSGNKLSTLDCDFNETLGDNNWVPIFYNDFPNHAQAVRAVMRKVAELGGERIVPFGFGISAPLTALKETP